MNPFIVFQQMLLLFAMILVGYFCYKKELITDEVQPKLSYLTVNLFNPFLVISSITDKSVDKSMELVLENILLVFLLFGIWIVLSPLLVRILRVPKEKRPLYGLMNVFSNLGFMGLPLISGLYGKGATIYVSFYMLMYNVLLYTYGIYVAGKNSPKENVSFQWKKIINPGFIFSLLAILIFFLQIPIPSAVGTFVSYMGNAAVPLSMILIGVFMARIDFKTLFTNVRIYFFCLLKLIVIPILLTLLLRNLNFDKTVLGIFVIMTGMPVGTLVVLLADEYEIGGNDGVQGIILSTLFSLITLPIVSCFF
ncbi:MAG: AEC family transporter [Lachnospiraceae bacterium]|nr:AEC family transporter [Lachnospiraceae bacterium]